VNEFKTLDVLVADEMETLCENVRVVTNSLKSGQSMSKWLTKGDNNSITQAIQIVTLPKIALPKFDGNSTEWCSFRDMFQSLVHDNPSISNIERFYYLLFCVASPALTVVKTVPLTADNYSFAWNALQKSYENQRLLITAHLEKLFAFAPLTKESAPLFLLFVNTFRENVAAIQALGVTDVAGFILFYIGSRVIDPVTRRLFETSIAQNEISNLDRLLEFAAQRCRILENVGSNYIVSEGSEKTRDRIGPKKIKGGRLGKMSLAATASIKTKKYLFCEHPHEIYR